MLAVEGGARRSGASVDCRAVEGAKCKYGHTNHTVRKADPHGSSERLLQISLDEYIGRSMVHLVSCVAVDIELHVHTFARATAVCREVFSFA